MPIPDDETLVACPHCGASTPIDCASIAWGEEEPVVDCTVCCQPIRLRLDGPADDPRSIVPHPES